ncbi:hypothetical protein N7481_011166 [Penicillium waksmanii]|uniref:uncharacterized protein n=1 Tax=Penicillium waksmanii TaxID=69791 RepID=UPI0025489F70|nr:uncharacterized protein N7481_011166 [Penicillium waksmanii]KAJ5973956.1 hypothetical protein N7481_011166 [Penicillium waksmanii]
MSAIIAPDEYSQQLAALGDDSVSRCSTDEETILGYDSGETIDILLERLSAWKHVCEYLYSYISATAKAQKSQSREYETILKSVSYPLEEGHHFKPSTDGVAGLFENIYTNTKEMVKVYALAERNLNDSVLLMLERLLKEIKSEAKQLKVDKSNGANLIAKAWRATQKHIILLAKSTRSYDASTGNKVEQSHDPYLLRQGVHSKLIEQATKEKDDRQENQEIQESFLWFEMHILQTVQCVIAKFFQFMGGQLDHQRAMYGDILGTAQLIHPDLEWFSFVERKNAALLDPEPLRRLSVYSTFPNKDHRATKPIIEGDLECHCHGITKECHYVVTRAGYLHGFGRNKELYQQPVPEMSLYLANCSIGPVNDLNFSVQGVNVSSRNSVNPFHTTTKFIFRAQSTDEAERWHSAIDAAIRHSTSSLLATADTEAV